MKKNNIFFSIKTSIILLLVFAFAMGVATFIEDIYDTPTSKIFIYNSKWFEIIMILLSISFVGNIARYTMLRKGKIAGLTFHLAFIVIILGAGITRYIGYEGTMHIREGQASNIIYTDNVHLRILIEDNSKEYIYDKPMIFFKNRTNKFDVNIETGTIGEVNVNFKKLIPNAIEKISENQSDGVNSIEIIAAVDNKRVDFWLEEGKTNTFGDKIISYNKHTDQAINLNIKDSGNQISIKSPVDFAFIPKDGVAPDSIPSDSLLTFNTNQIITIGKNMFLISKILKKAKKTLVKGNSNNNLPDAVVLNVSIGGKSHEVTIQGGKGFYGNYQTYYLDKHKIKIAYGLKPIELPFSLKLEDFILDRYAGSMSPSSYKSKVVLIDKKAGINEKHQIYMNNVLDYKGFRFFQSSYDSDELGTILSVSHDAVGTWTSYIGYMMLGIGFFLVFFSKESRFAELRKWVKDLQVNRKNTLLTIVFILGASVYASAQNKTAVSSEHADKLGLMIVQTYDGRFAPLQTLADDVMHKISRMDKFKTAEKGTLSKMQAFLDMQIDPEFWKKQEIVYIKEQSVKDALGVTGKYASFYDFFDHTSNYKLRKYSEEAFRKKPIDQNKFDREVIKLDERINVFMMTLQGTISKIFPLQNSKNNKWVSMNDSLAYLPLTGAITSINDDLKLKNFSYANFMQLYLTEVKNSTNTGNYSIPNKLIGYIKTIQNQKTNIEGFPSKNQLKLEVFYNKANIFIVLRNIYGILSILLLIFAFYQSLSAKSNNKVSLILKGLIVLLILAFLYHSFGMILRWYLTGHAPWSNGYEALILVAWGGLIAGFAFMKNSKITLAAATLMAFFMLMTAGHSSYDPQLTNLQPVLKSYWLIIHVATLTVSYGFLGAGFILGFINMILYILKNLRNKDRFNSVIKELTYINEMLLSLGVFLATIGTFLGGVWANESWGRYWGWDAKETWALVIVVVYSAVLHFRLIPKLKNPFYLNAGSMLSFSTVLMTFVGVNYYLSKGMHSYASGTTPVFPLWAWVLIIMSLGLIAFAAYKELGKNKKKNKK